MIPAFALASELIARGHRVALVTDERGRAIPGVPDGLGVYVLPAGRMQGGLFARIKAALAILKGRGMALALLRDFEPSAVVGFGGYPALPTLLAARAAKVPAVIHEQNAVLGRVNRFLAKKAAAIVTAYARVERMPDRCEDKVHVLGEYAGRDESRAEVSDPFGSDLASYRQTYDELSELIGGVVSRVAGTVR